MGGEDRVETQRLQARQRGLLTHLARQALERGGDRVGVSRARRAVAPLAQHTHALVLLDEVDQVEVRGERTRDLVGAEIENPSAMSAARSNASGVSSV